MAAAPPGSRDQAGRLNRWHVALSGDFKLRAAGYLLQGRRASLTCTHTQSENLCCSALLSSLTWYTKQIIFHCLGVHVRVCVCAIIYCVHLFIVFLSRDPLSRCPSRLLVLFAGLQLLGSCVCFAFFYTTHTHNTTQHKHSLFS